MTKKSELVFLIMAICLLSACSSTKHRAPVIEHAARPGASRPAPAEDSVRERDAPGTHTVRKGDTLLRIALDNGQNYRDLVSWNNLSNPNDIKVDQVLRVAPPEPAAVQTSAVLAPPSDSRPPVAKKTTPRGEKRAYSEAALAELQRADGGAPSKADAKPVAKAPEAAPVPVMAGPAGGLDQDKLSWMWPSEGRVIASFDEGKNKGIDIAGKLGQSVMAAGSGKVMYAGSGIRGYGNLVIVKHNNNLLSAYAHNRSIVVKEGQSVNKGQMIAEMGDSDAEVVKLHFEIRQQGKPVDPSKFLPNR
jgi:lipoprotein NlpD